VTAAALAIQGVAAEPAAAMDPAAEAFFEKEVRPLLAERCFECHGPQKQKGELRLDRWDAISRGGESGPVIVAGKPDESRLVDAINYRSLEMPPRGKLSDHEIGVLTRWVAIGAPWPHADRESTPLETRPRFTAEDRGWWAFQPIRSVQPPESPNGWARNGVDCFIGAKLQQVGLSPAPEASRAVLARRLYFDLWGLPPSPDDLASFVADERPDAYERLVDQLLESPRYGERWARLWLDLVRYADSDGYRIDDYRPQAWRYRDYVIDSLNADKPYDRFVQEQVAGDELFPGDAAALTATGYLRHGIYEYNSRDVPGQWAIMLNDITDTTGDVFLGLGFQCARCHDHKFDPILQKDYFRLQAFFAAIDLRDDLDVATEEQRADYAHRLADWEAKTAQLREEIATLEAPYRVQAAEGAINKFPPEIQAMIRKPAAERAPLEHQLAELAYRQVTYEFGRLDSGFKGESKERILALRKELSQFDRDRPAALPRVLAVKDVGSQAPAVTIPKKGDAAIEPGFLTLLEERPAEIAAPVTPNSTGRRSTLARWLTRPENPLTARVMVNRVWAQHFGQGLAANPSDFGRLGEAPSHPELLDWLSERFVSDGWSLKRLHKLLLTSATYRQSAEHPQPDAGRLADAGNRLHWRGSARRLDAEQIHDALYAATGELNLSVGGPGVAGSEPRRAIYNKIMRNTRDPLLDSFDAPFWFTSAATRSSTTTPIQSLLLINGQTVLTRAKALAGRLEREEPANTARRIERAFQLAWGRGPTADETLTAESFLETQARRIQPEAAGSAQASCVLGKIPYRDGQAALCDPRGLQRGFQVAHHDAMPTADFTIEAFVLPKSIYETGQVRVVASKWSGDQTTPGWQFGVTGKGSRRKPQTLVLQLFGRKLDGAFGEQAIFSDQHIQLDKPYYLAAAFKLATDKPGNVTFYVKDLSNDDEPLLIATVPHTITGEIANHESLGIGRMGASVKGGSVFDGLIDNVRWSEASLAVDELLFTREGTNRHTVGYWEFEPRPDVLGDSSGHSLSVLPAREAPSRPVDPVAAAWVDFCHVLLNASEFLYVE
jgi:hypothetical protein